MRAADRAHGGADRRPPRPARRYGQQRAGLRAAHAARGDHRRAVRSCLGTGAKGTLWAMQAAFPHLRARGGRIINFVSLAAERGDPGLGNYNATKMAILGLSRTAAREWGSTASWSIASPGGGEQARPGLRGARSAALRAHHGRAADRPARRSARGYRADRRLSRRARIALSDRPPSTPTAEHTSPPHRNREIRCELASS